MTQNGENLQLNGTTHKESEVSTGDNGGSGGGGGGGFMDTLLGAPELLKQKRRPEDLASLTREELIERILGLEKHVQQLRNVIAKEGSLHTITREPEIYIFIYIFIGLGCFNHSFCVSRPFVILVGCLDSNPVAVVSKRLRTNLVTHLPAMKMYA
jgi:hypothetical protein